MSALPFRLVAGAAAYAFVVMRDKARVEDASIGPEFLNISTSPGPTPASTTVRAPPGMPNVFGATVTDIVAPMSTGKRPLLDGWGSQFRIQPILSPPVLF